MDLWSFAIALPLGILIGYSSGILSGKSAGGREARRQLEARLRSVAQNHRIVIESADGQPLSYDAFMDKVLE